MIDFSRALSPDGILVVKLGGNLDLASCEYFFDCMQGEIDDGHHRIVVDCSDLGAIPSAGIGMLLRVRSRLNNKGGLILLADLQSQISDLLHFVHMDKVFRIYPTVHAALEALGNEDHVADSGP